MASLNDEDHKKAWEEIGQEALFDKATEEFAELTQVMMKLNKYRRQGVDPKSRKYKEMIRDYQEELADCLVSIENLAYFPPLQKKKAMVRMDRMFSLKLLKFKSKIKNGKL